mgnify:CR=1 FL=1
MLIKLCIDHILYVVSLRVKSMLVARKMLMTAFQHITNIDILFVVRSIISLMPLNSLLFLVFNRVFVSVMILLGGVQSNSISSNRNISPLMGCRLHHRGVVEIAILVVLDESVGVWLVLVDGNAGYA